MKDVLQKAAQIKLLIFDVDGVLTDGSLFIGDDGQEYKAFNSRDGFGMTLLRETGVEIGIITARCSKVVTLRMESLSIEHIFQGRQEKLSAYQELITNAGFKSTQVAYVGDDLVDIPVMREVGLAIAVADAHPLVKQHAHWQTTQLGGRGAARDVCELIMRAQGNLEQQFAKYL